MLLEVMDIDGKGREGATSLPQAVHSNLSEGKIIRGEPLDDLLIAASRLQNIVERILQLSSCGRDSQSGKASMTSPLICWP